VTELILRGGVLLTQNPKGPIAQALAVAAGKISAVGSDSEILSLRRPGTRVVDLADRTLIPGFIDAHAHIWKIGHLLTGMVDLRRTGDIPGIASLLHKAAAAASPGAWIQGRGFNESRLAERRRPDRHDLDAVLPDHPVVLTRTCGHIYACNTLALTRAGIDRDTPDPPGGVIERDASGQLTGLLHETAMGLINRQMPPPSPSDYARMILAALQHQLTLGITSTSDAGVSPALLDSYLALDTEGALPSRVNVMALRKLDGVGTVPLPSMHRSDHLRVDTVKFLADGGLSGATAALSVPYRGSTSTGVLRFEDQELLELAGEAHRAGWRIAIHGIGDAAIGQILRVYRALGPGPVRHRIEHLGLPDQAQLAEAARLGVISVPQSIFLLELGRNFQTALPDHLLARAYPIRAMLDAGLIVALSSDAPVVENDNPLQGMGSAVDRLDDGGSPIAPDQAITVQESLFGYTMGGAIASGDENNRGSLEPGKWADLAVLSGNPLSTTPLTDIQVQQTWIAGRLVFES
jgi:hypothetical protein